MDEEIKKLWEAINGLQYQIDEVVRLRRYDAQAIKKQKDLNITIEDNKRRNHSMLANQLKEALLKRRFGMDYLKVREFFHFKSDKEAYRLMDKAVKMYPTELMLRKGRGSAKGKRMIVVSGVLK